MNSYVKPGQGVDLKDLTHEEVNKIKQAVKKPEFLGLMNDYMMEISDPKNKDEYDQYLKQMADEGELPKGLKLIRPDPEFCVKTLLISKQDKAQDQKLFINICSATVVGRPTFETVTREDGDSGQSWSIPYSAGKVRYDQDAKSSVCNTVDVSYHPYTFVLCKKNPKFQELVCQTSLEAAQKQLGERKEEISKDYKILKKCKCKGGTPALLTIRMSGNQQSETEKRQGGEGQVPKLQKEMEDQKAEYQKDKKKGEPGDKEVVQEEEEQEEKVETEEILYNEDGERIINVPKHKFLYSYPVEYGDFLGEQKVQSRRPNQLGVDIRLPLAESLKEINLEINEKNLTLTVTGKYFLDLVLPYYVLNNDGSAKFDQKKKTLRIKLPINKEKLSAQQNVHDIKITKGNIEEITTEETPQVDNEEQPKQYEDSLLEIGNGQQLGLHFVKEETKKGFISMNADEQKDMTPMIQEIEQVQIEQTVQIPIQKVEIKKCEFKTQETNDKFFIIVNIPNYDKQNIEWIIFNQQVLLKYDDLKRIFYLRIVINKDINENESDCSLVTDYVVFNLSKQEKDQFWDQTSFESKTDTYVDYENFKQDFFDMNEAKKIIIQQNVALEETAPNEDQKENGLDDLEEDEVKKEEDIKEDEKTQQTEVKQEVEKENTQINFQTKNALQFINYSKIELAYAIN